jgi:hypothetical protein
MLANIPASKASLSPNPKAWGAVSSLLSGENLSCQFLYYMTRSDDDGHRSVRGRDAGPGTWRAPDGAEFEVLLEDSIARR